MGLLQTGTQAHTYTEYVFYLFSIITQIFPCLLGVGSKLPLQQVILLCTTEPLSCTKERSLK